MQSSWRMIFLVREFSTVIARERLVICGSAYSVSSLYLISSFTLTFSYLRLTISILATWITLFLYNGCS